MFDLFFPKHWSTLKKLIWLKAAALSSAVQKTVTGAILSIKDALAMPAIALSVDIDPVQSGSGDPSPDNVRPITGWTGCNIYHRGKNLFDEANATQYTRYISYINGSSAEWKSSSDSRSYAIEVIPGQTYTISLNADPQSTIFRVAAIKVPPTTAGTISSTHAFSNSGNPVYEITFTMREGEKWLVIQVGKSFADERKAKIQVEVGSTHTDYEAYSAESQTYSITFPDAAGTVYGGTLDVTTGVLTVTHICETFQTSSLSYFKEESGVSTFRKYTTYAREASNQTAVLISMGFASDKFAVNFSIGAYRCRPSYDATKANYFYFPSGTTTTAAAAALIGDSFQYKYKLPQSAYMTYQLTPQEVTMLLGNNTIWTDTGNTTLTYMADGRADDVEALNILLGGRYHNTPALYSEIGQPSQGDTPNNPIPYNNNMELFKDKYYSQNGVVYICTRNTEIPVYNNLSDLVGLYVEVWVG